EERDVALGQTGLGQRAVAPADLARGEAPGEGEGDGQDERHQRRLAPAAEAGEPGDEGELARGGELPRLLARQALEAPLLGRGELQAVEALGAGEVVVLEAVGLLRRERPQDVAIDDLMLFDVGVVHDAHAPWAGARPRALRPWSSLKRCRARKRT